MKLGFAQSSCSFPVGAQLGLGFAQASCSGAHAFSNTGLIKNPEPKPSFVSTRLKGGCAYLFVPVKLQCSRVAAVSDGTAVQNDCSEEELSSSYNDAPVENEQIKNGEKMEERVEVDGSDIESYDKLIEVFMFEKPTPLEWRRLLAFSKEWDNLRPHFFRRCQERADNEEDTEMKLRLLGFARKLKKVDEDVQKHNELLKLVKGASSDTDITELVRRRRKDFTKEFFVHLDTVALSYENKTEQADLARLGIMFLAVIKAYDESADTIEAINAAELKFLDLISSPTTEVACGKLGELARKHQFDPALMLIISKAWSEARQSNMLKDEAKQMLYNLYMEGIGNLQRLLPKDVRILKYLLTIRNPERLMSALNDAFTPGVELEGERVDYLYTTPKKLLGWMNIVLSAYYNKKPGSLVQEAKELLSPKFIKRMRNLKRVVEKHFM